MNDRAEPPVSLRLPDRSPDDLDRLLRDFFRAEMPAPWPAWSPPLAGADRPAPVARGRWPGLRRRLVLAASVALLAVGYWALAGAFPGSSGPPADSSVPMGPERFGHNLPHPRGDFRQFFPAPPKTVPVPAGGRARLWEQHLPGNRVLIEVEDLDAPARRR